MASITAEGVVVLIVLLGMFGALFFELRSPEMIVFTCLCIVWNAGIITTEDALSGFSNEGMVTIGALFIVVKAVERSGLVDRIARRVFGSDTSKYAGLFRLQLLSFALSGFFNNTPLVALLMPITRDWARSRGFAPSQFLIPLSYSSIVGGLTTVIGTSTNLVVQGLLQDEGKKQFGFFEPAMMGLPLGAILITYCTTLGQRLLPKNRGGMFRLVRDRASELITEIGVSEDCPLNGMPVEQFLESIGIDEQALLKIRRPCNIGPSTPDFGPQSAPGSAKRNGRRSHPRGEPAIGAIEEKECEAGASSTTRTVTVQGSPLIQGQASPSEGGGSDKLHLPLPRKFLAPPAFDLEEGGGGDGFNDDDAASRPSETGPLSMDSDHGTGSDVGDRSEAGNDEAQDGSPRSRSGSGWMPQMTLPAYLLDLVPTPSPTPTMTKSASMLRLMQRSVAGEPSHPEERAVDASYVFRTKHLWGHRSRGPTLEEVKEVEEDAPVPPEEQRSLMSTQRSGSRSPKSRLRKRTKRANSTPIDYRRKYLEANSSPTVLPPTGAGQRQSTGNFNRLFGENRGRKDHKRKQSGTGSVSQYTAGGGNIPETDSTSDGSSQLGYGYDDGAYDGHGREAGEHTYVPKGDNRMKSKYAKFRQLNESLPPAPSNDDLQQKALELQHISRGQRGSDSPGYLHRRFGADNYMRRSSGPMYIDIVPVPKGEAIQGGDVVFLSVGAHTLASFRQAVPHKGLKLLDVDVLDMTGFGTEVAELLLSAENPFLGEPLGKIRDDFQKRYSVSIIAARQKGGDPTAVSQAGHALSRDFKLGAGDTVLVNAFEDALDTLKEEYTKDFYLITRVGSIPLPATLYDYVPVAIFLAMLLVVTAAGIPISQAAFTAVVVLVAGDWVSSKEALNYVDFKLLALIGSALGLARSISASGLAEFVASAIGGSGLGLYGSLFLLYFFTVAMTELVTNNAAAALAVPIAIQLSNDLEVSHFPFAAAVLFGASTAFATPVGYQTNTMVWAPGGYKFGDFIKVGLPLDLCFMAVSVALIPLIWPFE